MAITPTLPALTAEPAVQPGELTELSSEPPELAELPFDPEEFTLDVSVVVAAHPNGKLMCDTSDGCGSTCSGSACNSFTDDPA
ncbi:FxLD family lanthipeptide [Streptomyces sulphureus]|uniref:FxLD family lanthipeptide n=1 Tax=Streptomyces sulphureus TaxID=47758 RepID=UPI000382DD49